MMGILKDLKQRCHILVQLPSSSQWLLELSHFCAFMFVVLGGMFSLWGSTGLTDISGFLFVFAWVGFFSPYRCLATLVLMGYQPWQAAFILGRLLSWIKQIPGTIGLRKYQCGNQTWRYGDLTNLLLCSVYLDTLFFIINCITSVL